MHSFLSNSFFKIQMKWKLKHPTSVYSLTRPLDPIWSLSSGSGLVVLWVILGKLQFTSIYFHAWVVALYCTILHYIAQYCTILHYIALYCTILHYIALYCTVLHCIALYCTILHYIALYATICHYMPLYATILHYIALYCTLLHHISLYCIILHYSALYATICHYIALLLSLIKFVSNLKYFCSMGNLGNFIHTFLCLGFFRIPVIFFYRKGDSRWVFDNILKHFDIFTNLKYVFRTLALSFWRFSVVLIFFFKYLN